MMSKTDRRFDLLVVGDANPDVVLHGVPPGIAYGQVEQLVDDGKLTIGGSAAILACGAARLGLRTAFVGVVGDDSAGRFMLEQLGERGVDTSGCIIDKKLPTGLTVVLADGEDRAILTSLGCMPTLAGKMIDRKLLQAARHLHASSYFLLIRLAADLAGLFGEAHAAGLSTSLDCQGDPTGRWDGGAGGGGLRGVLAATDLFFPNAIEAVNIAGPKLGLEGAAKAIAAIGTLPVIKCGADGALVYVDDGFVRVPAPAADVVDTVGAGDSFEAGFLYGRLNDFDLERCLKLAVACGSLSTQAAGGTAAQPTLAAALAVF
jgi:sugar/nucleoside kinase (ribokinase family)